MPVHRPGGIARVATLRLRRGSEFVPPGTRCSAPPLGAREGRARLSGVPAVQAPPAGPSRAGGRKRSDDHRQALKVKGLEDDLGLDLHPRDERSPPWRRPGHRPSSKGPRLEDASSAVSPLAGTHDTEASTMIGGSRSESASFGAWGRSSPHAPTCRHDRPRPAGPRGSRRGPGHAQPEPDLRQEPPYEARNGTTPTTAPTSSSRASAAAVRARRLLRQRPADRRHHRPEHARIAAVYDCGVTQGDVAGLHAATSRHARSTYTSDTFGDGTSTCYREAAALGFEVLKADGTGRNGTFIVDVTDPLAPKTVSFVRRRAGLAQPDRAPERQLPLQLELGPHHLATSRRSRSSTSATSPRRARSASWRSRRGPGSAPSRTTSPSTRPAPRLLGRALAGRDHRHQRSRPRRRSSRASSTRRSTSGTRPTRSRSPTHGSSASS